MRWGYTTEISNMVAAQLQPSYLVLGETGLLHKVRIPVVTDTHGNEVVLRRKQFWALMAACIAPAIAFAITFTTYTWNKSDRLLKLETIGGYLVKAVESQQEQINRLGKNESALERIDQRLIDIERRMGQMETRESVREDRRTP
jgi:hypothetical protein